MVIKTNIDLKSLVSSDRTRPTVARVERAVLEAGRLRSEDLGYLRCPTCQKNYLLDDLVCPRCGKLDLSSGKTIRFSGSMRDEAAFVKQPAGDAFAMHRPIVFEVNGARLELPVATTLVVGRATKVAGDLQPDVNLNAFNAEALGVSRQHIKIVQADDLRFVSDMGSTNGTLLNAHRLVTGSQRILRDKDELRLGHLKIRVRFATPRAP